MAAADLGAAELITLVFPGERAHPGVAAVLAELAAGRDIRVVMISRGAGRGAGKGQAVAESEAAVREAAKARLLAS